MAGALKSGTRPPWVGLAAGAWVHIAAGNPYNFPLYSHTLKSVLGYNQQQLTILGVANDIGENFGLVPAICSNTFPPWLILFIGATCCFLGYGVLWLAVSGVLALPYWLLWIALCIGANSAAWLITGVLVTNMRNFPLSRGTVAGILKAYVGLSAAVYTEIYTGMLHNSSTRLLLFLALGLPAICLAMMFFVRPCTPSAEEDSSERSHFLFIQILSVVLGVYLLVTTVVTDVFAVKDAISYAFFGIMIILLLGPLSIPLKMTLYPRKPKRTGAVEPSSSHEPPSQLDQNKTEPLLAVSSPETKPGSLHDSEDDNDVNILLAEGEGAVIPEKTKRRPKRGEDFNFQQALIKADFWLLFIVYFLGVGSGVTVINNLAQIGIAAGENDTTLLLCILSFCNFLGRLSAGVVSEYFVRSRMLPRSIWMTCAHLIMIGVCLLSASQFYRTLYVSTALVGMCYGIHYSVMVPTVSELFGLKHFGKFYNFMILGNPVGALLFSGLIAGYVYDKEAAKQHAGSSCHGPDCFRLTFLVLSGVSVVGTGLSIILTARVRPVYQMLYSSGSFKLPQTSVH